MRGHHFHCVIPLEIYPTPVEAPPSLALSPLTYKPVAIGNSQTDHMRALAGTMWCRCSCVSPQTNAGHRRCDSVGRPLAIRPAQSFHCPFDGRVCSGNRRRLLGNEPVRHGDLRTQNGILRQVTLVVHCQFPPIAVEPQTTFQDRAVRGEGGLVAPAE